MATGQHDHADITLRTVRLSPEEIISSSHPQMLTGAFASDENLTLDLQVGEHHLRVSLIPDHLFVLGRGKTTQSLSNLTVIDLTKCDAAQQGVSRHHAVLQQENGLLFVTDLGSTNGSWLNGKALPAHQKRMTRYGDELQLGNLKIKVFFCR